MRFFRIFPFLLFILPALSAIGQQAEHLGRQVNSEWEEREPILSPDGKTLYFWRRNTPANTGGMTDKGDIWFSTQDTDGNWQDALRMGPPLNSPGHDFVWQVSPGGDTLYLNRILGERGKRDAGIAIARRDPSGFWSQQKELRIAGFEHEGSYKDYFLTKEGVLLFPNYGDESYGGTDLYVSFPLNDSTWSRPKNLGPQINTAGDEDAPYLAPDGRTLYFGSNGRGGLGDHDIFICQRLGDGWTDWSAPENIGRPVNTPGYDFDFQIDPKAEYAWWGSDMNTFGSKDIFRLNLTDCALDVYPEGNFTLCQGDTLELEAGFTIAEKLTYQWLENGLPIPGATNRRLILDRAGHFRLIRYKNACVDSSRTIIVQLRQPPSAGVAFDREFICPPDSVWLSALAEAPARFQWFRNGIPVPGETRSRFLARHPGNYRVDVTAGACATTSREIYIREVPQPVVRSKLDPPMVKTDPQPAWIWAKETGYDPAKFILRDIGYGGGRTFILGMEKTGKNSSELILQGYDKAGKRIFSNKLGKAAEGERFFVEADENGNAVVAREQTPYLSCYSPAGELKWSAAATTSSISGLAMDGLGHIYTAGRFESLIRIGEKEIEAAARGSLFLAKHDPSGELLWVESFPVDGVEKDFGNALHTDCRGNIYLAGRFDLIANFGKPVLRSTLLSETFFLARFNPNGGVQWARRIDAGNPSFFSGDFFTACDGTSRLILSSGLYGFNAAGELVWQESLRAPDIPRFVRISADGSGHTYIMGISSTFSEFFISVFNPDGSHEAIWHGKSPGKNFRQLPLLRALPETGFVMSASAGKSLFAGSPLPASGSLVAKWAPFLSKTVAGPVDICYGDSILFEYVPEPGLRYEWRFNGKTISGADDSRLWAKAEGKYEVLARSETCDRLSETRILRVSCGNIPENDLVLKPSGVPRKLNGRPVRSEETITLTGTEATLYVWDHAAVDRDTISLNVNGEWVLTEYGLKEERKAIKVSFRKDKPNFVILYAHNLGSIPPNTAAISVSDGKKEKGLLLRSTLKRCGSLDVRIE